MLDAIGAADLILVAPSNPVVSIGPILAVPGIRGALQQASAPVVGFSGILGGAPVLGMAHRLLPAIGVSVDAAAVGLHYGARSRGGVLDVWAMDDADEASAGLVADGGLQVVVTDLIMRDPRRTAAFVAYAVRGGLLDDQLLVINSADRPEPSMITIFAPSGFGRGGTRERRWPR